MVRNNEKKSIAVVFYKSFFETLLKMPTPQDVCESLGALYDFVFNDKEPSEDLGYPAQAFLTMACPLIENSIKRYEQCRQNGAKGGAPRRTDSGESTDTAQNKIPTYDDVLAFCQQRRKGINAKDFYDFYEASNWTKNGQIVNWQEEMKQWERDRQTMRTS